MSLTRDTFCSFCGTKYESSAAYPRTCTGCKTTVWANPIPVSVVLLPVKRNGRTGLLTVRRGIQPGLGKLALVGGFLEEHETWQQGGARELVEETGAQVDPATLSPFWFVSTEPRPNRVLLFSVAKEVEAASVAAFTPNHETLERGLVYGPKGLGEVFAFGLHVQAAEKYFASVGITGEHGFEAI
jgi:ADP-ribose pyrophosphatase YjhB (NUDIX family)